MRIALVHNERAGCRVYTSADLVHLFRDAGYDAEAFASKGDAIKQAIGSRPQVLVVSGGDGTVAKVAIALRGSITPMFILPTGTSNNIARAVGVDGAIPTLIAQLSAVRETRFDVARIAGDGQEKWFVEGAGAGFIGAGLREDGHWWRHAWRRIRDRFPRRDDPRTRMDRAAAKRLRRRAPRYVRVRADGEDVSGEYVTVEVMNIPAIGPRILLAARADPGDARLELVLVRPGDRDALAEHIALARESAPPVEVRSVRRVELEWPDSDTHVDDELWPRDGRGPDRVAIDVAGAVSLLLPR